ncbi:pyrroline-5-carboxylate reductase [Campylobacter sp. VicNov18]|uniref:pyrroline-5-carboxylate reductase n=1 Tax=Campylobacter bilis TaxID=2691918 RepID=UPI00130EE12E|nr:pyrroline-5-carboxylate reductase [Campylobacter bilis]MPV63678.1 pyrroline-5-carboxylate reductase [Campylobacter hepaticus]MBM0637179.1 pyrroline-5-carboxylate reductase [Campylobacter bilis]MCC8277896.1 pyrroline-5-carboxylate reductase [Campylobacter bilis]MCC8298827.1 pyrroline-5-carboxylate reductase [Campylobacter bilis]MCC8300806.1 pyrroline-5-carboxylate reductase [Campylobacter bilis]
MLYILANGTMAKALAYGLKNHYQICIVGRNLEKLQSFAKEGFKILLYEDFDINNKDLILAFKPYALENVAKLLKGQARILISVLANTDFNKLQIIPAQNYARIMPNTAAKYQASTTPYILKNFLFEDEILKILTTFGSAYKLDNEDQMGAAMAISGCAPAFLALVAESIANAGVCEGLSKELSLNLTRSLFKSSSALLEQEHPAIIKENICSPGGVTIKGIKVLEQKGIRGSFFEAISASNTK